jgi:muramoyltetrapeptide carboxypeptidase
MVKISNHMKKIIPLKPGNILGVCAPSARFDTEKLNKGIQVIKDLGFGLIVPDKIFKKKRYLAGDDILRANIINGFFSDPNIDGIICARGGFGAMRVLNHLDWKVIRQNPKPFIGFSDNTALLLSIMDETGNLVIHGPTVVSFANARKETIDSFYDTLTGSFDKITVTNAHVIIPGKCAGILKGGNIATMSHLLGTRFQPDFKNTVLFLEDIGEAAYKIDRMLTQMKMAGMFKGIHGVIAGSFEKCSNDEYIKEILFEVFKEYHVPVLSGLDSGHGKINLSLLMGTHVEMDTATLEIHWK